MIKPFTYKSVFLVSLMTEERERLHQELKQRNKEAESQVCCYGKVAEKQVTPN